MGFPRYSDTFNGREYYQYHGKPVAVLPRAEDERPAKDFLRWHQERVYLG